MFATRVGGTDEIPDIFLFEPTLQGIETVLQGIFENSEAPKPLSENFQKMFSLNAMKSHFEKIFHHF